MKRQKAHPENTGWVLLYLQVQNDIMNLIAKTTKDVRELTEILCRI